jgi:hypothetical protein
MITFHDFEFLQQTFGVFLCALDPYDFNQTCVAISLATKKKVARSTHTKKRPSIFMYVEKKYFLSS